MTESKPNKHIHIVGCSPRSGTTLMQELMVTCFEFDWHCEHEQNLFKKGFRAEGLICTKHPNQIEFMKGALQINPNLHVIYMIRDPRDVIVSRHSAWPDRYAASLSLYLKYDKVADQLAEHPRFLPVRYEDLVTDPDEVQSLISQKFPFLKRKRIFSEFHEHAAISEDSARALNGVRPMSPDSIGKWRNHPLRVSAQFDKFPEAKRLVTKHRYEFGDEWLKSLPAASSNHARSVMEYPPGRANQLRLGFRKARRFVRYAIRERVFGN